MKRKNFITGLLMAILLVLSASLLSACGNDSGYTAKDLVVSEDTSSLEVNFASFKGSAEFSIKSGPEDNILICHGALTSGSVTVYCDYDGVETEVMTIESDEDYETYFEIPPDSDIKIRINAKSKALEGNFTLSTSDLTATSFDYLNGIAPLGSGNKLEGKVLVISVIVQNKDNLAKITPVDNSKVSEYHRCLDSACEFIQSKVASYGKSVEFIWDWKEDEALYYQTVIEPVFPPYKEYINRGDYVNYFCDTTRAFLREGIDSRSLRMKYHTRNIIYIVCKDPDTTCYMIMQDENSYAHPQLPYEWVETFIRSEERMGQSTLLAHEILHLFGAPDIYIDDSYYGNDGYGYGINRDFLEYLTTRFTENHESDIMRTVSEATPHKIEQQITEITAYYLGLIDKPDFAKEWNLYDSDYDHLKEKMKRKGN